MAEEKKYRMTSQRAIVLQVLQECSTHPTADEVYTEVKSRIPHISLGTVYRNLEFLCTQGMAKKIETSGSQRRYEYTSENHYHVRCLGCGKIEDIELDITKKSLHDGVGTEGYEIISHRLEFTGYCPDCISRKDIGKSRKG